MLRSGDRAVGHRPGTALLRLRRRLGALFVLCLCGVHLAGLAGCKTNQATGRSQYDHWSREQEIAVGTEAMRELIPEYGGRYPSPQLDGYVAEVGLRMAALVEDPEKQSLPWEFVVLDSEIINAFALPGGKIFVSRGLLQQMESEAELAAVLGHEIGHVTAEHAEQRIGRQLGANVFLTGLGIAGGAVGGGGTAAVIQASQVIVQQGTGLFLLKYSRGEESEADSLGVRYMVAAGYNPRGMLDLLGILNAASQGDKGWELLATHPYPETRLREIRRLIDETPAYASAEASGAAIVGSDRWKQRALPYLPGRTVALLPPGATCWCGGSHEHH
ncbi:MAG TPA: M48 family metalloprotease [Phycisphaerales bacterium]|nr:M48 family metalloprotease [Phycisphaerales bacterium]HMP36650.1 M48 family metalloprotease [Phycisphaerales bacterium]